jgi:hypothetical protein
MKRIRATISILTLAAASTLMTDALAGECNTRKGLPEYSPFAIVFETSGNGTVVTPVIRPLLNNNTLGKPLTEEYQVKGERVLVQGALAVDGKRCGHGVIAVNRFWNDHLFYTIEIMPGWYWKIKIPH